jgi:hypothetical protein
MSRKRVTTVDVGVSHVMNIMRTNDCGQSAVRAPPSMKQ